jgi:hypothetical protein
MFHKFHYKLLNLFPLFAVFDILPFLFAVQQNVTYAFRQLPQTKISFSRRQFYSLLPTGVFSWHICGVYFQIMLHLFVNQASGSL